MKNEKSIVKPEPKVEASKTIELPIHEVHEDAVIVNVDGWRIRVYFDKGLSKEKKSQYTVGRLLEASYFGDIENVHSLRFLPIK